MSVKFKKEIDEIDRNILHELQINARLTFSEIGRKVGLSSPAVTERVHKMEESGIILGYRAELNPKFFGLNTTAFLYLRTQAEKYSKIYALAEKEKQIIECHHISGNESMVFKVVSSSISQLDDIVKKLSEYGETKTSIVLSTHVEKTTLDL